MPELSRNPTYNLKAVLHETGLTSDVLHAWERRYELPLPERPRGARRLYSAHDVAMLKWMKARQAEGLGISRAVKHWNELVAAGRDPFKEYPPVGLPGLGSPETGGDAQAERLSRQWLEACLAFDETSADEVINQAFALYPVEKVCLDFLARGLREIGELWYRNQASIQQEHYATSLATRRLGALIATAPAPSRLETILVGCPPEERHSFSALMLALFLRRKGFRIVYLGADVPMERLSETFQKVRPNLVVLGAQRLPSAASLYQVTRQLQEIDIQAGYGGWIFSRYPSLRERIPAHYLGDNLEQGVETIELLVNHPQPVPLVRPVDPSLVAAARLLHAQRVLIDGEVLSALKGGDIPAERLEAVNGFLGDELAAALELGDRAALAGDIEWIQGRMARRTGFPMQLSSYLAAYTQAARKILGPQSSLIVDWLEGLFQTDSPDETGAL